MKADHKKVADMATIDADMHRAMTALIACVLPENTPDCDHSIGACGQFSQEILGEYKEFQDRKNPKNGMLANSFSSSGFGYSDETVQAMNREGFPTGQAMAVFFDGGYDFPSPSLHGTKDVAHHIGQGVAEFFNEQGIRVFWASGGPFPGDTLGAAIILDVTDPDFLTKLKPAFLKRFPVKISGQVLQRFSWDANLRTEEAQKFFIYNVFTLMKGAMVDLGKSADVDVIDLNQALSLPPMPYSGDHKKWIEGLAEHDVQFSLPALRLMGSVLTAKDVNDLVLDAASLIAGLDTDQQDLDVNFTNHIQDGLSR